MTELYLNGYRIELGDIDIAQTYQVNDIAEIKDRQTNFTNRFQIPPTPGNMRVMDYLGIVGSSSISPYRNIQAKVVVDGIELMPEGFAHIKSFNGNYECVIYDGTISMAEALTGKKINELDYYNLFGLHSLELNHINNLTNLISSFNNSSGYIHAMSHFREGETVFNADYNPGAIFVHTLWDMIFKEAGLEYSGNIFSDAKFLKAVVTPIRGHEVALDFDTPVILGDIDADQIFLNGSSQNLDEYFTWGIGTINQITNNSTHLTFNFTGFCKLNITGDVSLSMIEGTIENDPIITIEINGNPVHQLTQDNNYSNNSLVILVKAGDQVKAKVNAAFSGSSIHYTITAILGVDFSEVEINNEIDYSTVMPDVSQLDFLKEIMQRFGMIFRKVRNQDHFEFITIEDLLNDKTNAEDWSSKLVGWSENYELSNYAQKNKFAYGYDDGVKPFADGYVELDNETLADEKTVITSIFKATDVYRDIDSIKAYFFSLWEEKNEDGETVFNSRNDSFRIFEIERYSDEVQIKSDAGINAVLIPISGTVPHLNFEALNFDEIISLYYSRLQDVLNRYVKVEANLLLDPVDIYQLDFFKLKYIEQLGGYFYLNKVSNFKNGKITKCELIRVAF